MFNSQSSTRPWPGGRDRNSESREQAYGGARKCTRAGLQTCPCSFRPQAQSSLPRSPSTHTTVCSEPQATIVTGPNDSTLKGMLELISVPTPSWPQQLSPDVHSRPPSPRNTVWKSPQQIETTFSSKGVATTGEKFGEQVSSNLTERSRE